MAGKTGISHDSVSCIWRAFGLKPHSSGTLQISTGPHFASKVRDVVGLCMSPPEHALVLCVDEKRQIQALERSQPVLPMRPGKPEGHRRSLPERHHPALRRTGAQERQGHRQALPQTPGQRVSRLSQEHRSSCGM